MMTSPPARAAICSRSAAARSAGLTWRRCLTVTVGETEPATSTPLPAGIDWRGVPDPGPVDLRDPVAVAVLGQAEPAGAEGVRLDDVYPGTDVAVVNGPDQSRV